mgnify:CR=1 FL=1
MTDISEIEIGSVYKIKINIDDTTETITFYTTMADEDSITINVEDSSTEELVGQSFRINTDELITETLTGKERGTVKEFIKQVEPL